MPCFYPQQAYRSTSVNSESGKRLVTFVKNNAYVDMPITLRCGQCSGCRWDHSREWAIRCHHEASLWPDNCFVTLTYNDDHLPYNSTLLKKDVQLFMKRLRKKFSTFDYFPWTNIETGRINHTRQVNNPIRLYYCGEYGEKLQRPHYHLCLFNHDFHDKKLWKKSDPGMDNALYRSADLESLWTLGHSSVGRLTLASAGYVARYIMKKINGDQAETHYHPIDPETGEILERLPEFTDMSRAYGIGKKWFENYVDDIFPDDFIVIKGKKYKVPKFYNTQYEAHYPDEYKAIKTARKAASLAQVDDNTPSRLKDREKVHAARLSIYKRSIEEM